MSRAAPYFPKTVGTGDGTTKEFTLGFPFLHQDHLRIFVDGVLKTIVTDYTITDPTSPDQAKVKFVSAPANAAVIKATRNTPIDRYKSNPQIGDQAAMQALYRMQEAQDARVTFKGVYGQTALLAGTALSFVMPFDGYVEKLRSTVVKAITTGGAITVEVDTVAVTGLSVTVADSAIVGTVQEDTPTTAQSSTTKFKKGQTVTVTPAAAFATAGDIAIELEVQPADLS